MGCVEAFEGLVAVVDSVILEKLLVEPTNCQWGYIDSSANI